MSKAILHKNLFLEDVSLLNDPEHVPDDEDSEDLGAFLFMTKGKQDNSESVDDKGAEAKIEIEISNNEISSLLEKSGVYSKLKKMIMGKFNKNLQKGEDVEIQEVLDKLEPMLDARFSKFEEKLNPIIEVQKGHAEKFEALEKSKDNPDNKDDNKKPDDDTQKTDFEKSMKENADTMKTIAGSITELKKGNDEIKDRLKVVEALPNPSNQSYEGGSAFERELEKSGSVKTKNGITITKNDIYEGHPGSDIMSLAFTKDNASGKSRMINVDKLVEFCEGGGQ